MIKSSRTLLVCGAIFAMSATAWGGVTYSVDGGLTTTSTSWSGAPAIALATPSQGNVPEGGNTGGGVVGIAFFATSSFTLGELKFETTAVANGNNVSLAMYNLGPTVSGTNPRYTIDGSSVNLFSAGLNFTYTTGASHITSLVFDGADQVSIVAGNYYTIELLNNDLNTNILIERASTALDAFMALGTGATGSRVNVPAGDRDPVAAIYAVPEPSALALAGVGLMNLFARRQARGRK